MAAIAKGTEAFHRSAKVLDGQLKGQKIRHRGPLTLADFSLAAGMVYADPAHCRSTPYGEIKRWFGTIERAAVLAEDTCTKRDVTGPYGLRSGFEIDRRRSADKATRGACARQVA